MQVMDMGLDFKSYSGLSGPDGLPVGNVSSFTSDEVSEAFEPTVGLFVTLLHLAAATPSLKGKRAWFGTYSCLQQVFASTHDGNQECRRAAEAAKRIIDSAHLDDPRVVEELLQLLDSQCEIRGPQAPSQRRLQRDPKGVFCNLHLSDRTCNAEFGCNQLHLIKTSTDTIKHRTVFFCRLVDVLRHNGFSEEDIRHRVTDAVFFSRFGNRVTVLFAGHTGRGWVQFFKTSYTKGRLLHALRISTEMCAAAAQGMRCQLGPDCLGIHIADERNTQFSKPLDIPTQQVGEIREALAGEVARFMNANPNSAPPSPTPGRMGVVVGMTGTPPPAVPVVAAHYGNTTSPKPASRVMGDASTSSVPQNLSPSPDRSRGGVPPPAPPMETLPRSMTNQRGAQQPPQHRNSSGDIYGSTGSLSQEVVIGSPTTRGWAQAVEQYKSQERSRNTAGHQADSQLLEYLKTRPVDSPVTPEEFTATPLLKEVENARFEEGTPSSSSGPGSATAVFPKKPPAKG
jgi:hypothetical protein